MLYNVLLVLQILIALSIIGLVLIQHGKGADAGAAFGGGASGTVFGARGSGNFLSRSTAVLATLFFANSLLLAWMTTHPETSGVQSVVPVSVTETVKQNGADADSAVAVPSDVPQPGDSSGAAVDESPVAEKAADVPATSAPRESADEEKPADIPE